MHLDTMAHKWSHSVGAALVLDMGAALVLDSTSLQENCFRTGVFDRGTCLFKAMNACLGKFVYSTAFYSEIRVQ